MAKEAFDFLSTFLNFSKAVPIIVRKLAKPNNTLFQKRKSNLVYFLIVDIIGIKYTYIAAIA